MDWGGHQLCHVIRKFVYTKSVSTIKLCDPDTRYVRAKKFLHKNLYRLRDM